MSIHSKIVNPEKCDAFKCNGVVFVSFSETIGFPGFESIEIATPKQAHALREAVNNAVDMILGNEKKGL